MAALFPLFVAVPAFAQHQGFAGGPAAQASIEHQLDLRLGEVQSVTHPAPLMRGMIFRQDLSPNAAIGLGLANIYARRGGTSDWRVGEPVAHSRKPAVTFLLRF